MAESAAKEPLYLDVLSLPTPRPSSCAGSIRSFGRGGAGNIRQEEPSTLDVLSVPTPRLSVSSARSYGGIGGRGNIQENDPDAPPIVEHIPKGPTPVSSKAGLGGSGNLRAAQRRSVGEPSFLRRKTFGISKIGFAAWSKNLLFGKVDKKV